MRNLNLLNKIHNESCLETLLKMEDNSVDLIILDPPYLTTKESWDQEEVVNQELAQELFRVAKDSASLYLWCGMGEKSQSLIRWFPLFQDPWYFKDLVTWKKQRGMGARRGWLYTREEVLWFVKDNKQFVWNKESQYSEEKRKSQKFGFKAWKEGYQVNSENYRLTNVWTDISETSWNWKKKGLEGNHHFTPKPEKAIERILLLHTKEGDIVYDPFMGSGTTALVAKKLNRNFIGSEINPDFIQISENRLSSLK